ncbi:MAG: Gfo/Idh/MocA family oxidoreductase [Candidatus Lokiarchaeota archaeon]|nr:Gfo/Idh/MocA family oxidoreductase [Candidatus Lokiarchaeota archaeon]
MAPFRIGVIGAGGGRGRGWARHVKSWEMPVGSDTTELSAIADIDELALNRAAEQLGCKAYKDYMDMLDKENLNLVIIATPHYTHAPMSIAAAERKIHVLCEKPMCINLEQADAMKAAVEKYKVMLAVGFQHRFNPIYVALKRAIEAGDIGEIFQINMIYHWWRAENYFLNSTRVPENKDLDWEGWKGHWLTEGGSCIFNQHIHFLDIFQWLSPSPIKSVYATSRVAKHTFIEADDNTNAIVEFKNGAMGLIQAGVAYQHGKEEEFGIYGTEGQIISRRGMRGTLGIPKLFDDRRKPSARAKRSMLSYMPKKLGDLTKLMYKSMLDAIATGDASKIAVDVNEGRKSVELSRAMLLSQTRKQKIEFPYKDTAGEYPELVHTYEDKDLK